jgi:YidC/Oxa1 family membrane protein insertase
MQIRNLLLFLLSATLLLGGYFLVRPYIHDRSKPSDTKNDDTALTPPTDKEKDRGKEKKAREKKKEEVKPKVEDKGKGKKPAAVEKARKGDFYVPAPTPDSKLITLGSLDRDSPFHLRVLLDPRGGGVRSVVLNRFQQADAEGRPEWEDRARRVPRPLELVRASSNEYNPSHLLFHYTEDDKERPLDTLGKIDWKVVEKSLPTSADGRLEQRVSFQAEVDGVRITKTYTLAECEYHLGMEIKLERFAPGAKSNTFRYQFTGAHGFPIEGRWYTSTFQNSLIARYDRHGVNRDLQELRRISNEAGGDLVGRRIDDSRTDSILRYAGVAIQYFASVTVVDNNQPEGQSEGFLNSGLPTLETAVAHGVVRKIELTPYGRKFVLLEDGKTEITYHVPSRFAHKFDGLMEGQTVAVLYRTAPFNPAVDPKFCPRLAFELRTGEAAAASHALWEDEITVRVNSEPIELEVGQTVVHRYLLYNGPVKVSQLAYVKGAYPVPDDVIERYRDRLQLNTLTDYHSPGWFGRLADRIWWTALIIKTTNLMHWVLGKIHRVVPNYGLCIILLTVLVRGLMFPLSRKQALTSLKMQELAPEIKKLAEKHKDDRAALGAAQMALYRKHGINPFGTCWFLLLQMPIFMGLYYALQESILFRLAPFWPTWIQNLAAPDMMISWTDRIPWISRPADFGGFIYLGPFLNILPIIAVALMIVQQKMMTPPPTDEQQAMQQKMMKYMMVFMGFMFYKVPAGLCVYFIASSLWGFAERKLLPKSRPPAPDAAGGLAPATAGIATAAAPAAGPSTGITAPGGIATAPKPPKRGARNRRKAEKARQQQAEAEPTTALGRFRQWARARRQRLAEWWANLLEKARKK